MKVRETSRDSESDRLARRVAALEEKLFAAMERFFSALKHEWTNHQRFANLDEARSSVFRYIETFYNPRRLHEVLERLSPDECPQWLRATKGEEETLGRLSRDVHEAEYDGGRSG